MSEWIKCSERLPSEKQMVTIFGTPKGAECRMVWGGVVFSQGDFWDFDIVLRHPIGNLAQFIKVHDVTHWQPLPLPPSL